MLCVWRGVTCTAASCSRACADRDAAGHDTVTLPLPQLAACIRTGRWLSCFGKRAKSREAQILEKMKVLDDIVSDSGVLQLLATVHDIFSGHQQQNACWLTACMLCCCYGIWCWVPNSAHLRQRLTVGWLFALQITESLCQLAQQQVSLQLSAHLLAVCCLPWRRPAASGTGKCSSCWL
jgi:hypothetical protein